MGCSVSVVKPCAFGPQACDNVRHAESRLTLVCLLADSRDRQADSLRRLKWRRFARMQRPFVLAFGLWLIIAAGFRPATAFSQTAPAQPSRVAASPSGPSGPIDVLPEPKPPAPSVMSWLTEPDTIAEGTGALIGFIAFNFYVAPIAAAAGPAATGLQSWLGTRVVASTLAATGAVLTTTAYDVWSGRPLNYVMYWGRGGAVAGVAAGSALLGVMGYPASAALSRFSPAWVANRSFLVGTALLGDWAASNWARSRQSTQPP